MVVGLVFQVLQRISWGKSRKAGTYDLDFNGLFVVCSLQLLRKWPIFGGLKGRNQMHLHACPVPD